MNIQLKQVAPDFEQDGSRGRIRFGRWLGGAWGVLFSHPRDDAPVCTTVLARLQPARSEADPTEHRAYLRMVDQPPLPR